MKTKTTSISKRWAIAWFLAAVSHSTCVGDASPQTSAQVSADYDDCQGDVADRPSVTEQPCDALRRVLKTAQATQVPRKDKRKGTHILNEISFAFCEDDGGVVVYPEAVVLGTDYRWVAAEAQIVNAAAADRYTVTDSFNNTLVEVSYANPQMPDPREPYATAKLVFYSLEMPKYFKVTDFLGQEYEIPVIVNSVTP